VDPGSFRVYLKATLMNILMTSIVDMNKSQHNRPHQLVKHFSNKHDITVLSINYWWKRGHEETCILCVLTLRDNAERPETVEVGVECACGDGGDVQMRPEHA